VRVVHVQAVDQLVHLDRDGDRDARLLEDRRKVRILEGELALDGVVVLVERSAGDDDAQGRLRCRLLRRHAGTARRTMYGAMRPIARAT
jgi:hypothetical protein